MAAGRGCVVVALANSLNFDDRLATDPEANTVWSRMMLLAACG
jgi:hypothetical protein